MTYQYSFKDCLARAERITWRVEDLIGGDKTGDKRFYDRMIPIADTLYDEHLTELEKEQHHER